MVLAAEIVGSGEPIEPATFGAQGAFAALWVVLLNCALKHDGRAEQGCHAVALADRARGFDRVPGPRLPWAGRCGPGAHGAHQPGAGGGTFGGLMR